MSTKGRSPLLSAPLLVVMLAVLLAIAGVAYTHWYADLELQGDVQTGHVGVSWSEAWTNDDGNQNYDPSGTWHDDEPVEGVYDGTPTSADPMENAPYHPARWDKDVGECYADGDGGHLNVSLHGVYPSYNCNMTGVLTVDGNVPVRATAFTFEGEKRWWDHDSGEEMVAELEIGWGPYEGNFTLGVGGPEIEGDIGMGVRCGAQLDPSACNWFLGAGTEWYGHVSGDDQGNNWADLDGFELQCNPSVDLPDYCWVDYPEGYEPNGEFDEGDLPVSWDCDPESTIEVGGWLHILQEADQGAQYSYMIGQEFVNWNEFSYCLCTDGVPGADTAGEIIGVVDHGIDGCLAPLP